MSIEEKQTLERQHRTERDKRVADRIKAVLLFSEGWTQVQIAQALRIHVNTVHDHLSEYLQSKKLHHESGGSSARLTVEQTNELIEHLEKTTYVKVINICAYVEKRWGIVYTVSGMTKWLHTHNFSFKKPKGTPAKCDPIKQAEFEEAYRKLLESKEPTDLVIFGDGVHPTMATKVTYGWIRTGKEKLISTIASRTRINVFGGINLATMDITTATYKTLNGDAMVQYFTKLRERYPEANKIHLILDQGRYNTCLKAKEAALERGIILHFLPPYSPNLNPIERLWKVMNEYVRNNRVFKEVEEFRQSIAKFFNETWPQIASSMRSRINDNFQKIKPAF